MKKVIGYVIALCFIIASSTIFCACDPSTLNASFTNQTIQIEKNGKYDPFGFVTEIFEDNIKKNVSFATANSKVAYINDKNELVGVDYGETTLTVLYKGNAITTCQVEINRPLVQLLSPTNVHFDESNNYLTWDYSYAESYNGMYKAINYEIKYSLNGIESATPISVTNSNYYRFSDFGVYKVYVRTITSNAKVYKSSEFSTLLTDAYTFNLMATPIITNYDNNTHILTWDGNKNPSSTAYKVCFKAPSAELQEINVPAGSTTCVIPSLTSGKTDVYVKVVPKSEEYFGSASEVLSLTKLLTPEIYFNNGEIAWNSQDKATSYYISIDGTYNKSINLGEGTISTFPRTIVSETSSKQHQLNFTVKGDASKHIYDSDATQFTFTKLPKAKLIFNTTTKTFYISTSVTGCKFEFKINDNLISNTSVSSFSPNLSYYDNILVSAQIKSNKITTEIDGDISKEFYLEGSSEALKKIQILKTPNLSYVEEGEYSKITFTELTANANYKVFKNDSETPLTAVNGSINLGKTKEIFPNVDTYNYKIDITKPIDSTEKIYYLKTNAYLNVEKLVGPTTLTLNDTSVSVNNGAITPNGLLAINVEISTNNENNRQQTNELLQNNVSSWKVFAKNIANTNGTTINNIKTFYTSSNESEFNIVRLGTIGEITYDYSTNKFNFAEIENASAYNFYADKNSKVITATINRGDLPYYYKKAGSYTTSWEAIPTAWTTMTVGETKYFKSLPKDKNILQSENITNLHLTKSAEGVVSVHWTAPINTFEGALTYSVIFNDEVIISNLTITNYELPVQKYANTGTYKIEIAVFSTENNFYAPNERKLVNLTRLSKPIALYKSSDGTKLTAGAQYINDATSGLKCQIGESTNVVEAISIDLNEGEEKTYIVSAVGVFDSTLTTPKYYLDSAPVTFTLARLNKVNTINLTTENIIENSVNKTKCMFSWTTQDEVNNGDTTPSYINYVYKTSSTSFATISKNNLNIKTTEPFTFYVKAIVANAYDNNDRPYQWTDVKDNEKKYLDSQTEASFDVKREIAIKNMAIAKTNNGINVTWDFDKVYENYDPTIKIVLTKPDGSSIVEERLSSTFNNTYSYEFLKTLFDEEEIYTISLSSSSNKTMPSVVVSLDIEKLPSVKYISLNSAKASLVKANGEYISTNGISSITLTNLSASGIINFLTNDALCLDIDLSTLTSQQSFKFSLELVATNDKVNGKYYISSNTTNFEVAKIQNVVASITTDLISWDERSIANSYTLKIVKDETVEIANITTRTISLNDSRIKSILGNQGVYTVSVKAIRNNEIIGINQIGYISSEYGDSVDVQKLGTTSMLMAHTATREGYPNDEITQEYLQFVWNAVSGASAYNLYLYNDETSSYVPFAQNIITTSYITTNANLFKLPKKYSVKVEAIGDGKIAGDMSSAIELLRLNNITSASVDANLNLTFNEVSDLSLPNINFTSYIIRVSQNGVLLGNDSVYGFSYPIKENYYSLARDPNIASLNGSAFTVSIMIYGDGGTNGQFVGTLSSGVFEQTVYKFKAPTIEIQNNKVHISSTDESELSDKMIYNITIKNSENIVLTTTTQNDFEIPADWNYDQFNISCYVSPIESVSNYVTSNESILNNVQRIARVSGVVAEAIGADFEKEQTNVKISWDGVAFAEKYYVYKDNVKIGEADQTNFNGSKYSLTFVDEFAQSGQHPVTIKAVSSSKISSLHSNVFNIIRLNPVVSPEFTQGKVITYTEPAQSTSSYRYLYELYFLIGSNKVLNAFSINANAFENLQSLDQFEGGKFYIKTYVTAMPVAQDNIAIFTSPVTEIECYKLFAPSIVIKPDLLKITTTSPETFKGQTLNSLSNNIFSIKLGDDFAKDNANTNIENKTFVSDYYYPTNLTSGVYTFLAQTTPNGLQKNIIPSNQITQTATRLNSLTNLNFYRDSAVTSLYHSDDDLAPTDYVSDVIKFAFTDEFSSNTFSYLLKVNRATESLELTQTNLTITGTDLEEYLHRGTSLSVIAHAEEKTSAPYYINSAPSEISYSVLAEVSSYDTTNGKVTWKANANAQKYLIKTQNIATNLTNYWQSSGNKTGSQLKGILYDGQISSQIKSIGNITTLGISENVVLDGKYTSSVTFTKLSVVDNLRAHLGYIAMDKVSGAEKYLAKIFDQTDTLLKSVYLTDYTTLIGYDTSTNTFIGHSNDFDNLTKNTLYKIKLSAESSLPRTIFSDDSEYINVKVLENANKDSSDIKIELNPNGLLTEKNISAMASKYSHGLLQKNDDGIIQVATLTPSGEDQKLVFTPTILMGNIYLYCSFASLGSSSIESGNFYYLSSSFTTSSNYFVLPETVISINNGTISWTKIDKADGYYVFINGELYENSSGGFVHNATTLSLPSSYANSLSTKIDIEIASVESGTNYFSSPKATYSYTYNIGEEKTSTKIDVIKLHQPEALSLVDGRLIWKNGLTSLEDISTLDNLISAYNNLKDIDSFNAIDNYLVTLFNAPIELYSKYVGFNIPTLVLTLSNGEASYTIETSASSFLNLTSSQSANLNLVKEKVSELCLEIVQEMGTSSTNVYATNSQIFASSAEYLSARATLLQSFFESDNFMTLSRIFGAKNGFPTTKTLFEELNSQTKNIPAGEYSLSIMQKGNNFDFLNSSISSAQTVYLASSPLNLEIFENNGDFYLSWSKVTIPSKFNYAGKDNAGTSHSETIYVIYGEDKNGERQEIVRTLGEEYGSLNKLRESLTALIDGNKLGTNITKLFIAVIGDDGEVITGLKSSEFKISVLALLSPTMENGEIVLTNNVSSSGFEIKAYYNDSLITRKTFTTNRYIGDEDLDANKNYTLAIRALGKIISGTEDVYVLTSKKFVTTINKLDPMEVSVNMYGQFVWDNNIANSQGFIVTVNDKKEVKAGDYSFYEASEVGFNTFKFRTLGTVSGTLNSTDTFYLSSKVNNSEVGTLGCMLSSVITPIIEDGLIKWGKLPINTDNPQNISNAQGELTIKVGYRLSFNNGLDPIFLQDGDIKIDSNKNDVIYFDFTSYGSTNNYIVTIQAYIYYTDSLNRNFVGQVGNIASPYSQLLGVKKDLAFEKIAPPSDLKIVNGELTWTTENGAPSDLFYIEVTNSSDVVILKDNTSNSTSQNTWWTDSEFLSHGTNYGVRVKSFREDAVFSEFANLIDIQSGNKILFTKLDFAKPTISEISADDGNNYIRFAIENGLEMGINLKYFVNNSETAQFVNIGDSDYAEKIKISGNNVSINVNALGNDIQTMQYYLQLSPKGEKNFFKSNFVGNSDGTAILYSTPVPVSAVYFDDLASEYYWKYLGETSGYIVKDELYKNDVLIATLFYTISPGNIRQSEFCKIRAIDDENFFTVSFAPTFVGFTHKVSVSVASNPDAVPCLNSPYTLSDTSFELSLFGITNNVFDASLFELSNVSDAIAYISANEMGSALNPYLISTAENFDNLNKRLVKYSYENKYKVQYEILVNETLETMNFEVNVPSTKYYFKQTANLFGIDKLIGSSKYANGLLSYKGFAGSYDGNYFSITYNLTANSDIKNVYLGLFNRIETNGEVKNLAINASIDFNANITNSTPYVGIVTADNKGTISKVKVNSIVLTNLNTNLVVSELHFGGIACENSGNILNSVIASNENTLYLQVSSPNGGVYVGGITSKNSGNIENCGSNLNFTVESVANCFVGGIAGQNYGVVTTSYNKGNITASTINNSSATYVGGICGTNTDSGSLSYCYASGIINAKNNSASAIYAGGLVGYLQNKNVNKCYSSVPSFLTNDNGTMGGTLFGVIESYSSTSNVNYYKNASAVGGAGGSFGSFAQECTDLALLLGYLNGVSDKPFALNGNNLEFVWESGYNAPFSK